MDALILSCGTGGGHNAAANALKEELIRRGHHVQVLNPYHLRSSKLESVIDQAYIKMVQKLPALFGCIYKLGDLYRRLPFHSPVYFVNGKMAKPMEEFLKKNPFDIILMPHLYPAEILTYMKKQGICVPPTIFIATDYTCIPFTEESECDAYIIPAKELTEEFSGRGIPVEKIYPLGIPVSYSFNEPMTRKEAKARLGLEPEKRYILVSGGSMGASKIEKTIGLLHDRFREDNQVRMIVICGNNNKLYEKLKNRYGNRICLVGHTDKMAVYLNACELYLTKPGGLSSTEAAVAGIPLIHLPPIPGCETRNVRFFNTRGLSFALKISKKGDKDFNEAVGLWNNQKACSEMICRQREKINAKAAIQICDLAEKMAAGNDHNTCKEDY